MGNARVHGVDVPGDLLGELRDSSPSRGDSNELQARMAGDGYVFIRQALDPALAIATHQEAMRRLVEVDEIEPGGLDGVIPGVATGRSRRRELQPDLGVFWKSVSEGPALRRATHGPELRGILSGIFGEEARPHDYLFLRVGTAGKATDLHYDMPFFCRGSERVHTVWIAFGDIAQDQGPLMVLEGSNRFDDLLDPIRAIDYDRVGAARVAASEDAITVARKRNTRLLTTHFQPGDAIVFSMSLMHGSLDYHAEHRQVRLSCDIRFQPKADATDPRYFGPNPGGTTGVGYGELNGAKPLTDAWHVR